MLLVPLSYISRQADKELLALCQAGNFAYVLTARQMGKSSLMFRTAKMLEAEAVRSVLIDLTEIGRALTAEQWYYGILTKIKMELALKTDVHAWWQAHAHLGVAHRLTLFFREVLLAEMSEQVVIFVDEIDSTLGLNFTDDFYAAIRYFYNARPRVPEFKRLSFVLIGVATPSDLISDPKRTPFNIGQQINLSDFTLKEARPLAAGLGLRRGQALQVLAWGLKWTGGHPYLTQHLCQVVANQTRLDWSEAMVEQTVADTFLGPMSQQDRNLQFVRNMLTRQAPDLARVMSLYRAVREGLYPVPDEEHSQIATHLKLSGIVRRDGNTLRVRNPIYSTEFDLAWIEEIEATMEVADPRELARLRELAKAQEERAEEERRRAEAERQKAAEQQRRAEAERQKAIEQARAEEQAQAANRLRRRALGLGAAFIVVTIAVILVGVFWRQAQSSATLAQTAQAQEAIARQTADIAKETAIAAANQEAIAKETALAAANREAFARQTLQVVATQEAIAKATAEAGAILEAFAKGTAQGAANQEFIARQTAQAGATQAAIARATSGADSERARNAEATANAGSTQEAIAKQTAQAESTRAINAEATAQTGSTQEARAKQTSEAARATAEFRGTLEAQARETANARGTLEAQARETANARGTLEAIARQTAQAESTRAVAAEQTSAAEKATAEYLGTQEAQARQTADARGTLEAIAKETAQAESTRAFNAEQTAIAERTTATAIAGDQSRLAVSRQLAAQSLALQDSQYDLALLLSLEASRITDILEARGNLLRILESKPQLQAYLNSADEYRYTGKDIALHEQKLAFGSGHRVILWNLETEDARPLVGDPQSFSWVTDIAFSKDGDKLAWGTRDGTITVWNMSIDDQIFQLPRILGGRGVQSLAFSSDGQMLAFGTTDKIMVLDITLGITNSLPMDDGRFGDIHDLTFNPQDSNMLVSGDGAANVRLWNVNELTQIRSIRSQVGGVLSVAFSNNGQMLAWGGSSFGGVGNIMLWKVDIEDDDPDLRLLSGHTEQVRSLVFSPDDKILASGSRDTTIKLWDINTGRVGQTLTGIPTWVTGLVFGMDGQTLISGSKPFISGEFFGQIIKWDIGSDQRLNNRILIEGFSTADNLAFNPQDSKMLVGSIGDTVMLWNNTDDGEFEQIHPDSPGLQRVHDIVFRPDGQILAYAGCQQGDSSRCQGNVRLWSVINQAELHNLIGYTDAVYGIAFSPNGRILASGDGKGMITLWNVETPSDPQRIGETFQAHGNGHLFSLIFIDDEILVSGHFDSTIKLWRVGATENPLIVLNDHRNHVTDLVINRNDDLLVSSSGDFTVRLWDLAVRENPQPITRLSGHTDWVESVAISADGRTLASGGYENSIRMWDAIEYLQLGSRLVGHDQDVQSLAFSPDGRLLASASEDGKVILWEVGIESWKELACSIANRNLTQAEIERFIPEEYRLKDDEDPVCNFPFPAPAAVSIPLDAPIPTSTGTPTATASPVLTAIPTAITTPIPSFTPTPTATLVSSPTVATFTPIPSFTATLTPTPAPSLSPTFTPTPVPSFTATLTPTPEPTFTATLTPTPTPTLRTEIGGP